MNVILLDNFDSFTYNLVAQLQLLGHRVRVFRNDLRAEVIADHLLNDVESCLLVLSPGPGAPREAGCMMALLKLVVGHAPILGICLGHQALVEHYGGTVGRADSVVHGKSSLITHTGEGAFKNIQSPLKVARYHSLVATAVPECLDVTAVTSDSQIMAIAHRSDGVVGFQFHPESILTTAGIVLLANTITYLRMTQYDAALDSLAV